MAVPSIVQFNFPTLIRFGAGAVDELGDYLKAKNISHPLLVTDPLVVQLDFTQRIIREVRQKGISVSVFSDIHRNPVKSDVIKGRNAYDGHTCDAIVGLGGGAAIDVARAIALSIHHREDLFTYDDLIGGDVLVVHHVPPFVAIPTTSGTGSEVGRSAIIAEDETLRKRILFSPKLMAEVVFADPLLTLELPPSVTAATGMDALTHNMEAFLAKMDHPICEGIALEGMRLIASSLEKAVLRPDLGARSDMLLASMMGAIAFQKGLGVVHSLAHPLSSLLDTHHGLANAVNLPYGMAFNADACSAKFHRMAHTLDLPGNDANAVLDWIRQLNESIGIPSKLRELGVMEQHLDDLTDMALADFAHPNNPIPLTRSAFYQLYRQAL